MKNFEVEVRVIYTTVTAKDENEAAAIIKDKLEDSIDADSIEVIRVGEKEEEE